MASLPALDPPLSLSKVILVVDFKKFLLFLSDPEARFSKSIGWADAEGRTYRYAMIIDNGKVTYAAKEAAKNVLEVTCPDSGYVRGARMATNLIWAEVPSTMSKSPGQPSTPGREMAHFVQNTIMGVHFDTASRYSQSEPIGVGVSGLVCSARDKITHRTVAIKKLVEPSRSDSIAQHMFREAKLLKQLQHENTEKVVRLNDIFVSSAEEIYLVTDLMATDLHSLLKTKKVDNQFTYAGLSMCIQPESSTAISNRAILINENCDPKICDFGLARAQENEMTGYVSTRYYRAPEVMLTWKRYNEKVDIWSVGCIFAEMILGRPLFPGKNHIDQFCVITKLLGSPPDDVIADVDSPNTLSFVRSFPKQARKSLSQIIPGTNGEAVALLEKVLQIDPDKRCSAAEALAFEYLAPYHDPSDGPVATDTLDLSLLEANLPAAGGSTLTTPKDEMDSS
ncbi:hypothetical protein N7451_012325 [Penicillium sp. IBT 35674x]|nr:hypothetical protein N7451_012325 [Penicillium sp. IBT 35674x]